MILDRIALMLGNKICPVMRRAEPEVLANHRFMHPEKKWESEEGFYVEYMRSKMTQITWSTNVDCDYMKESFKSTKQPPLDMLLDYGTELMECYKSPFKMRTLSRYAISQMPDEMFYWLYDLCTGDPQIFDQFMKFYLHEAHEEIGGVPGYRAFSIIQHDKLKGLVTDKARLREVLQTAGSNLCVHVAKYALSLNPEQREFILNNQLSRRDIPRLPLDMSDNELSRFMSAVRCLIKQ